MLKANKWLLTTVSATLISSIALWEGVKTTPYRDVVGVLTVCHGYTGKDIVKNKTYTIAECNALLNKTIGEYRVGVLNCVKVPLLPNQFDAFVLFAYNMGVSAFCNAGFVEKLNQGQYTQACNGMATHPNGKPAWSNAGGKYWQGLQNRRQFEKKMCLGDSIENLDEVAGYGNYSSVPLLSSYGFSSQIGIARY